MTPQAAVTEFSLRARIREVMDGSATADPKAIADEVLARINTRDAMAALEQALPSYVRIFVGETRRHAVASTGGRRSWKAEGARDYAAEFLRRQEDVVGDGTGWKFIAECDAEDMRAVAMKRRQQAADLVDTAAWYEKIAGLLDEHSAATVGALPEPVLLALATNGEVTP